MERGAPVMMCTNCLEVFLSDQQMFIVFQRREFCSVVCYEEYRSYQHPTFTASEKEAEEKVAKTLEM